MTKPKLTDDERTVLAALPLAKRCRCGIRTLRGTTWPQLLAPKLNFSVNRVRVALRGLRAKGEAMYTASGWWR